jgi:GNAT superfamily N-acetyltransferase
MAMSAPEVSSKPEIDIVPATMAEDQRLVGEITDLTNSVYAVAEAGLWVEGAARTTTAEVAEMIAGEEITLARVDGRIVGSIRIQQLDGGVGEFGMLDADPDHRGEGIGRELVRFAEELSRRRGLDTMQLELLVPRDWTHRSSSCWSRATGRIATRSSSTRGTRASATGGCGRATSSKATHSWSRCWRPRAASSSTTSP